MDRSLRHLRPRAAARYLGVGESTLAHWRVAGTGPVFSKINDKIVIYTTQNLDRFAEERLRASTREPDSARVLQP
jgi:hypothetical protein